MASPFLIPGRRSRPLLLAWFVAVMFSRAAVFAAAPTPASLGNPGPADEAFLFTPAGFDREGQPVWASGAETGQLQIVVRDAETGRTTPCRVNVVGPDGNFYQPPPNHLSLYALTGAWPKPGSKGNRVGKAPFRYVGRFFYMTGESSVAVPAGRVRVEVWKGLEYRPETVEAQITRGGTQRVEITLTRAAPMAAAGYHSGDSHLHLPRLNAEDDRILLDLLEAEDLRYGYVLTYNEPAGPYSGFMHKLDYPQTGIGPATVRSRGNYHIMSGQEYRSGTYGHMNLYLLNDLIYPGKSFNAGEWPVYGEVAREVTGRGGFTIMAHGGYGQEIWADAALGTVSAVELLQFGVYRGIELDGWYAMLNSGYRFPAQAASDYPPCRTLADCRTYVQHPTPPTMAEWLGAIAGGRSFFTTGPLVLLEVDGQKPGGQIRKAGAGPHTVKARLRVRSEVTPVTDIDLIVNGRVVEHRALSRAEGQGRWIEIERDLAVSESSWIAARAYSRAPIQQPDAEAHTNPVFVYLNNRAPFQRAAIDTWVTRIDEQIAIHNKRAFPERAKVLAYFQSARDLLLKIRAQGGLAADANPAKLALEQAPEKPGVRNLAADGSAADPTETELKAFLTPTPPPPAPAILASFETAPGFRMDLVAAEPLVRDPIAAAFDADGNLYVAEMTDYPYNGNAPVKVAWQDKRPPSDGKPRGTIRLLRDTNGDGRFDTSTVFADGLLWAGGIQPWQGGVFVAAAPDIWYFKDTDGDGKADIREKVFTGFGTENQQGAVNSLVYALDHHIYGSTSVNGGEIRPGADSAVTPVSIKGRDFRFEPTSRRFEPQTGTRQFGLTFDDWGNRFLCSQSEPAVHVVLPLRYLERNPWFTAPATIYRTTPPPTPVRRISPIERWRHIRSSRRVAGNERPADSAGVSHHVIDAGAGVTVYRGGSYPAEYYGNIFVGDSVSNLVHRRALVPEGGSFRTERVEPNSEFVRSSDIWFRPVNFVNAPDGTLYCLDMAREYSETINIPADVEKHLDLTSGREQGRIYRIAPADFRVPPPPRLSRATGPELVAALSSPHSWWRDTAHRLIFERQDRSLAPALEQLARGGATPQARVHALWSLEGLQALTPETLAPALSDPHPGVRLNAVRLAESRLERSAALREKIEALVNDPDSHVRLQVAFTIGESSQWNQAALLARLVGEDGGDGWLQSAVLSSAAGCGGELFGLIAGNGRLLAGGAGLEFARQLAITVGAQNRPADVARSITAIAATPEIVAAFPLAGALGEGLKRAGVSLASADRRGELQPLFARAPGLAADAQQPDRVRRAAIETLALLPYPAAAPRLLALLGPGQAPAIQVAAVAALEKFREPQVAAALMERYATLGTAARARVLEALLARADRIDALCDALASRVVRPGELTATQISFLRKHKDARVRERATKLLGGGEAVARQEVVQRYLPALQLTGDAGRGQSIFDQRCASCHRHGGRGQEFGPHLDGAAAAGKERLLTSIVDPNREVLPRYFMCSVETRDGESIGGIVESDTAAAVTLRQPGGATRTVARDQIASLKTASRSFMPEGLEAGLGVQEMADLLGYLGETGR